MNIYKARFRNALKKAARVNFLLKKGYLILAPDGTTMLPFKFDSPSRKIYQEEKTGSNNIRYLMFQDNRNMDHGLYTPISEFNKKFDRLRVIHPKHIKKFK
jgi:hypothetical protein